MLGFQGVVRVRAGEVVASLHLLPLPLSLFVLLRPPPPPSIVPPHPLTHVTHRLRLRRHGVQVRGHGGTEDSRDDFIHDRTLRGKGGHRGERTDSGERPHAEECDALEGRYHECGHRRHGT